MTNKKDIHHLIESCIEVEKNTESNPFLSTRIMAAIQKDDYEAVKLTSHFWKAMVATCSLAIVMYAGFAVGNLYQTENNTQSIVLMNDDRMENFSFLNKIGNEK